MAPLDLMNADDLTPPGVNVKEVVNQVLSRVIVEQPHFCDYMAKMCGRMWCFASPLPGFPTFADYYQTMARLWTCNAVKINPNLAFVDSKQIADEVLRQMGNLAIGKL